MKLSCFSLNLLSIMLISSHFRLFSESRSVLIGSNYDTYLAQELEERGPSATILLDQYVFTRDLIQETLAQEAKDGARVSINMYRSHRSNSSTYYFFEDLLKTVSDETRKRMQVNKYPGMYTLHAKHLSWFEDGQSGCHIGSHNLTNLASEINKELMVVTYDDQDYFQQCKLFHDTVSWLCGNVYEQNKDFIKSLKRSVLQEIPARRMVLTSLWHDINASLISFINTLGQDSYAMMGAYSMNDIKVIDALCRAADRGADISFFIDGQTINTKTEINLLNLLHAHRINIFLYNYDGSKTYQGYKAKMHAKFYAARTPDQPTVTVISTRNFTKQFGLNMASVHPDDEQLFDQLYDWCTQLAQECDYYQDLGIV